MKYLNHSLSQKISTIWGISFFLIFKGNNILTLTHDVHAFFRPVSYITGRNGSFYNLIKISYAAKKEHITGVELENQ